MPETEVDTFDTVELVADSDELRPDTEVDTFDTVEFVAESDELRPDTELLIAT